MKVLYLATRGEGAPPLSIETEVDMLSRTFSGTYAEFRPLSWSRAENLARDLANPDYDILHVTAHGEGESLQVLTERGATVALTAERILSFLPPRGGPRLVYVNACESEQVARLLTQQVPFAIGSTLPLANGQAIQGALAFYWRVLLGRTVREAFQAAHSMVGMLSDDRTNMVLYEKAGHQAAEVVLMPEPMIVAAFCVDNLRGPQKFYEILFGVEGVPGGTTQIVFFSDDPDLISDEDDTLAEHLCAVARGVPSNGGSLWCDRTESWDVSGDFRVYAVGVTADGNRWTAATTLCDALERWEPTSRPARQRAVDEALRALRAWGRPSFAAGARRPNRRRKK